MILCWFFLDLKLSAAMIGFPLLGMFFVFVWHFDEWSIFQNSNIIFHFRNFLAIRVIHFGTSLSKFTNYLCIFLCFFLADVESQQLLKFSLFWFKSTARLFLAKILKSAYYIPWIFCFFLSICIPVCQVLIKRDRWLWPF